MINAAKLPLYLPKKIPIYFQRLKENPYELHILVENANLLEIYPDLQLSRQYHKYITAEPFLSKRPTQYLYQFEQNYRLIPVPFEKRNFIKDTLLLDTSFAKIQLLHRYHINNFRTVRAIKIMNDLLEVDNNKTNVLLYVIDVDKPFAIPLYRRTIWPWLLQIRHDKNFQFDQAILCIIEQGVPTYVNLGFKDKYNLQRILAILKSIKPKHLASVDSLLEEKIADPTTRYAIKQYIADKPQLLKELIENPDEVNWDELSKRAIVYLATGSDKNADLIKDKKVIEDLKNSITVRQFAPVKPEDPVLENTRLDTLVSTPDNIYSYRQVDYVKNLHRDILHVLSSFSNGDIPLKVKKVKIQPVETPPNELRQTKLIKFTITVEDHEGVQQTIELMLPRLDGNIFTIYGKHYTLINQLALKPLTFPKPYMFKLTTSYSIISGQYKLPTKKTAYYHMFVGGMQQPACLFFSYMYGLDESLQLFGIKNYKISEAKTKDKECFKIGDKFLVVEQELEVQQKAFLNGFNKLTYPDDVSLDDNNFWKKILITNTKNFNAEIILKNIFSNILDLATQEVLRQDLLPLELNKLLVYAYNKIVDPNNVDTRNDLATQRLRHSEIISQYVQKMLRTAYSAYVVKRQLGDTNAKIEVNSQKLISQIIQDPNMQAVEKSSPVEELSYLARLNPTGLGGVPTAEAVTTDYRNIHTSYYGNISAMDTPESGKIGATQHLAIGSSVQGRGIFAQHEFNDALKEKILSPLEALIPFVNYNEGARVLFATNQMRSAIPTINSEPPIIQTGYESILTRYLSDSFIIKAPCNGNVTIKENIMLVKCENGDVKRFDLSPQGLRSGQIVNVCSKYNVKVQQGPIKKGQVLATSDTIKDNMLSFGVNLHTVVMSYRGYNFEDAIVISESTAGRMTSRHLDEVDIQITPNSKIIHINTNIDEEIKAGSPLIEFIPSNLSEFIELLDEDLDSVTGSTVTIRCPYDGKITDIEVYPGDESYIVKFPQLRDIYSRFIKRLELKHGKKVDGNFKYNGNKIDGVIVKYKIEYEIPMGRGDKFANRHGNKGVVGLVLPDDMMPKTPFGTAEIIINPLGIEGRSNLGQLLELYVGLISYKLSQIIATNPRPVALQVITNVYNILNPNLRDVITRFRTMTKEEWDQLVWRIKTQNYKVPIIIPPFIKQYIQTIKKCLAYLKLHRKYRVFIPELNTYTKYPVPVGWCYWEKLEHIATFKLSARSTRSYISKTLQPPSGKKKEGGQRLGELDSWALLAYDCPNLFWEFWGALSDDHVAKQQIIKNIIENGHSPSIPPTFMPTRDAFIAMLLGMHLEVVDPIGFMQTS